jgi:hypothetical protein
VSSIDGTYPSSCLSIVLLRRELSADNPLSFLGVYSGKGEATGELRTKGGIQSAPIGEQETKEEKDQGINVLTRTPIERYEADFMKAVFGK